VGKIDSGLRMMLTSSSLVGRVSPNGKVKNWPDSSGFGAYATALSTPATFVTSQHLSLPAVRLEAGETMAVHQN